MFVEQYDPLLVILSFVVAVLGSATALYLAGRLTTSSGRLRLPWLVGGAFVQGTGIWGMHFTGMLAFSILVPIAYDIRLMALSFVVAFAGALVGLYLTYLHRMTRLAVLAGGVAVGLGICGLHYIDMAAMRMAADIRYSSWGVLTSAVVAIVFGVISLSFGRRFARDDPHRAWWLRWLAGLVMGFAIVGQHYIAMSAASFPSGAHGDPSSPSIPASDLPEVVLLATLAILSAALAGVQLDKRDAARTLLSKRLLAVQESERRRIARDLHDDLGQLLTTVRLNLARVDDAPVKPTIADSIALIDDALNRVRTLSVELRPSVLDDLGLVAAVEWYAKRIGERAGFAVEVRDISGPPRPPEELETAGFRIVQQALTNVARHAHATNVLISLRRSTHDFELSIIDDGGGFAVGTAHANARAGESLGLLSMQEIAALAGGTLSINSTSSGTTIRARFPLPGA